MTHGDLNTKTPFGDRRTALAFFISLIVIITYTELIIKPQQPAQPFPPAQQQTDPNQTPAQTTNTNAGPQIATDTTGATTETTPPTITDTPSTAATTDAQSATGTTFPTQAALAEAGTTTVVTERFTAEISHLGGRLLHFKLADHTTELGGDEQLDLVSVNDGDPLPLGVQLLGGSDANLSFGAPQVTTDGAQKDSTITLAEDQEARVVFQLPLTDGGTFTKSFRFLGDSSFIDLSAKLSEEPSNGAAPLAIAWNASIPEEIASSTYDPVNFSMFLPTDKVEHEQVTGLEPNGSQEHIARWASLGDKYFMGSLISTGEPFTVKVKRANDLYSVEAQGDTTEVKTKVFIGPKLYSELKNLGFELHRNVNLGIFSFLAIPLLSVIIFLYGILGNYGLAIILLTLLIKLLFLPLTQVSFRSMKAMQDLQPEIKALRERISDPNQLNQEMFALYKRKGVNPMGGCLPMLIQIPVFLGLYNALLNATELRHAPFALWVTDLSAPEALYIAGIPVPVMILMMGASMFMQQWLTPSNMDEQQKKIMMIMPVMFTVMFIIFPFPSGLVLYWLVNNLISIVQQVYLRTDRSIGPTQATVLASIGMFLIGYTLTLL